MSSKIKDISKNHCSICDINLNSEAELAIHEFCKRHCDNLLRLSKNKPIRQKIAKTDENQALPTPSSNPVQVITEPGNFALYGYFTPGGEAESKDEYAPKEYNYDYDPYLQKLAENPAKVLEKAAATEVPAVPLTNVTSFSNSKKRKKRSCQICNVSMLNVPQYEEHMKSAQHACNLKMAGMGVSAHFVKAGADLHTADGDSDNTNTTPSESAASANAVPIAPSELFCDICEILLNSQSQYEAHLSGKSHNDKVKQKESLQAKKNKNETPIPDQLYCYSCKLVLNNVAQYNDHKNGKKHKLRCTILVRKGITIPPEERTADMQWAIPRQFCPVRYPEFYLEQVNPPVPDSNGSEHTPNKSSDADSANKSEAIAIPTTPEGNENTSCNEVKKPNVTWYNCNICECHFAEQSSFESHLNGEEHAVKVAELKNSRKTVAQILSILMDDRRIVLPDRFGRYICAMCSVISSNESESEQHLRSALHKYAEQAYEKKRTLEVKQAPSKINGTYRCELCQISWATITEFNVHLHAAEHKNLSWKEYVSNKRGWPFGMGSRTFEEKNPGVRTKVSGVARDLHSGEIEPVPNLEQLEPKIDPAKNINIGISSYRNEQRRRHQEPYFPRPRMLYQGGPMYDRPQFFPQFHPYGPPRQVRPLRANRMMPPAYRPPPWY